MHALSMLQATSFLLFNMFDDLLLLGDFRSGFFFFCLLDWRSAQNFSQLSVEMVRRRNVKTTTTLLSLSPKGGSGNWAKALTLDAVFKLGFGSKLRRNDCGFFSAFWVFYFGFLPIEVDFCFIIRHSNPPLHCVYIVLGRRRRRRRETLPFYNQFFYSNNMLTFLQVETTS